MSSELPTVEVGPIAHGGHCVARLDGQVVFVRHALPGERVRIRITDRTKRFLRADAVDVIDAAPGRVEPPCRFAAECGGCDFQHATPETQRELLTVVVREQLQRLAGFDWHGEVEAVDPEATGWRTRVTWSVDDMGRTGLRRHRSHDVVPVDRCLIAHPDLPVVTDQTWDDRSVETIVSSTKQRMVVTNASISDDMETRVDAVVARDGTARAGSPQLTERVLHRDFQVTGSGFWQVHPAAATTLVQAVLAAADVQPGDRVVDLYAGVGLFTAFLAEAAGPTGSAEWVESGRTAVHDARVNLAGLPVTFVPRTTEQALRRGAVGKRADVVVLDPPRTGAKAAVRGIAALGARTIVYVACDPAALSRDLKTFADHGYLLDHLRAFALFPMTHHVECVALLKHADSDLG